MCAPLGRFLVEAITGFPAVGKEGDLRTPVHIEPFCSEFPKLITVDLAPLMNTPLTFFRSELSRWPFPVYPAIQAAAFIANVVLLTNSKIRLRTLIGEVPARGSDECTACHHA
jgi:hypothetical protein